MLESVQYGRSGLSVSRLCLGTMNFGEPGVGQHGHWTLSLDEARPIFKTAMDQGLYYFDCANNYGMGASERVVGALLRELFPRESYVLTTKLIMPMAKEPNRGGLSRKHVMEEIDAILKRLGLDYVDQLVVHRHPSAVPNTPPGPLEEGLEALHDVVKSGKALYIGASSMYTWQFVKMRMISERNGWHQFISMQNHYNLIYREEEREMHPYCEAEGIAVTPWSPLARGVLTGSYKGSFEKGGTKRSQGGDAERAMSLYRGDMEFNIVDRVAEVAEKLGHSPAQIALAWMLSKPVITSPVIGVSRIEQLNELVAATKITLGNEDIAYLEELYRPVANILDDEKPRSVMVNDD